MMLDQLKRNVKDGLDTVNIYKSSCDNDRNIHCYIMAIVAYLGIYQIEKNSGQMSTIYVDDVSKQLSQTQ